VSTSVSPVGGADAVDLCDGALATGRLVAVEELGVGDDLDGLGTAEGAVWDLREGADEARGEISGR
jgi:hypothetical protein